MWTSGYILFFLKIKASFKKNKNKKTATQKIQKDHANKPQGLDKGSLIQKHGQQHGKSKTHREECLLQ